MKIIPAGSANPDRYCFSCSQDFFLDTAKEESYFFRSLQNFLIILLYTSSVCTNPLARYFPFFEKMPQSHDISFPGDY